MNKIFIIIGSLDIGGTEKQLLLKLKTLKNKFNFTVIVFQKKGLLFNEFRRNGINVLDLTNKRKSLFIKPLTIFYNLFKVLRVYKPKIVNLYLPHSYLIAGFLAYFFKNITFIMSRRSLNFYQKKFVFIRYIEKNILHKKMKFILANSNSIKRQLITDENVAKEKVKVIYNSVKIRKKIKKVHSKFVRILCIANLIKYKNHELIIKSCKELQSIKNFQVDFIGSGNKKYETELINLSRECNVENKINFWGSMKNFEKISALADIGILSSNEEGFSNAILEYMSLKLPVVVTDVGGNSEIVTHGFNGYLVEKGNHLNFAKYLKMLILDKNLRKKLGKRGYETVKEKFEFSKNFKSYECFYNKILQNTIN
tara:strand:- start:617 stop:1720 length:1104 start_codon:yes stop_codon:yes gene_type:complete